MGTETIMSTNPKQHLTT